MLLHWSKNFRSVPTHTTNENDGDEVVDHNASEGPSPTVPFFPRISGTGRHTPSDFLPL